jgi:hypothetical protein
MVCQYAHLLRNGAFVATTSHFKPQWDPKWESRQTVVLPVVVLCICCCWCCSPTCDAPIGHVLAPVRRAEMITPETDIRRFLVFSPPCSTQSITSQVHHTTYYLCMFGPPPQVFWFLFGFSVAAMSYPVIRLSINCLRTGSSLCWMGYMVSSYTIREACRQKHLWAMAAH